MDKQVPSTSKRKIPLESLPFNTNPADLAMPSFYKLSEISTADEDLVINSIYGFIIDVNFRVSKDIKGLFQREYKLELRNEERKNSVCVIIYSKYGDYAIQGFLHIGNIVKIQHLKGKGGDPIFLWTRIGAKEIGSIAIFSTTGNEFIPIFYSKSKFILENNDMTEVQMLREFLEKNLDEIVKERESCQIIPNQERQTLPILTLNPQVQQPTTSYDEEIDDIVEDPYKIPAASDFQTAATILSRPPKLQVPVQKENVAPPDTNILKRTSDLEKDGKRESPPKRPVLASTNPNPNQSFDESRIYSPSPEPQPRHVSNGNKPRCGREFWQNTLVVVMDDPRFSSTDVRLVRNEGIDMKRCVSFGDVYLNRGSYAYWNHLCQVIAIFSEKHSMKLRVWDGTKLNKFDLFLPSYDQISVQRMIRWKDELIDLSSDLFVDIECWDEHGNFVRDYVKPGDYVYLVNVHFYKPRNQPNYVFAVHSNSMNNGPIYKRRVEILSETHKSVAEIKKKLENLRPNPVGNPPPIIPTNYNSDVIEISSDDDSIDEITGAQPLVAPLDGTVANNNNPIKLSPGHNIISDEIELITLSDDE